MLQPKPRPATYADLEALPDYVIGEILFGGLKQTRRPPRLTYAVTRLVGELYGHQLARSAWWVLHWPELHLGPHVVVPDIAGWRRERLQKLPDTAFIETPPDWICEVLSPSTQRIDRTDKLAIYATFGVKHAWYVDPLAKTMEVLALQGDKWLIAVTFKDADPVTAPPFEAHTFPLDVLWPEEQIATTA